MRAKKPSIPSKRVRRASEEQVLDYVRRYYPEMGEITVEISPCGTFASVRDKSKPKGRRTK
jgi:hypothetical protein